MGAAALSFGLGQGLLAGLPAGSKVGVDIVEVSRIAQSLREFGERFEARLFTPHEIAYARAAAGQHAERLAARFAAKEAAIKALGFSDAGVDWREMEVRRDPHGACSLVLHGKAAALAAGAGVRELLLSLSHDGDYAVAAVVAAMSDTSVVSASAQSVHDETSRHGDSPGVA